MEVTNLNALKINRLTVEQYETEKEANTLSSNEVYFIYNNDNTVDIIGVYDKESVDELLSNHTHTYTDVGLTSNQVRNIVTGTSAPTSDDGNDGDIWIQYS